jgi:hypothetical protein
VRELMSMIAPTKAEKVTYLKFIFYQLWHGKTEAVLDYLKHPITHKSQPIVT